MKLIVTLLALAAATPAVAGDYCADLWFTRNAIIDRAGYCFGSTLGQRLFDNGDCIGKSVSLSDADKAKVALIQQQEKDAACRIDTSRTALDLPDIATRRRLIDLPVSDGFESACIGWLGDPVPLRAGHSQNTDVIGEILPGDSIIYGHLPEGGWTYVTISSGDWQIKSAGWYHFEAYQETCAQYAG